VAAEALVESFTHMGLVRGLSLRLVASAGAFATHGLLLDVCRKLASPQPELELLGDAPGTRKPLMHVGDTAAAIVYFGLDFQVGGALNISLEDTLTVEEAAGVAMEAMGKKKPIRWLGRQACWRGDDGLVRVSAAKARRLGWRPQYETSQKAARQAVLDIVRWWK
jgi:nucleoside-diphosphate-sugar epimerase